VKLAVHFIRARSRKEENCGREEVGEIGQSSITRRMVFHILFMLQPFIAASLFRLLGCFCTSMASLYFLRKYDIMLAIVIVLS